LCTGNVHVHASLKKSYEFAAWMIEAQYEIGESQYVIDPLHSVLASCKDAGLCIQNFVFYYLS